MVKKSRKVLALILSVCVALSMVPALAFAEESLANATMAAITGDDGIAIGVKAKDASNVIAALNRTGNNFTFKVGDGTVNESLVVESTPVVFANKSKAITMTSDGAEITIGDNLKRMFDAFSVGNINGTVKTDEGDKTFNYGVSKTNWSINATATSGVDEAKKAIEYTESKKEISSFKDIIQVASGGYVQLGKAKINADGTVTEASEVTGLVAKLPKGSSLNIGTVKYTLDEDYKVTLTGLGTTSYDDVAKAVEATGNKDKAKYGCALIEKLFTNATLTVTIEKDKADVPSGGGGVAPEPEEKPEPPKVEEDGTVDVPTTKPDENGKVEADVPEEVINDAIDKVIENVKPGTEEAPVVEIKVEVPKDSKVEAVEVKVDSAAIDKLASKENVSLKVESNVGALELDNDVLKEISKNAGGQKVSISIEKPKVEKLPAKQQDKIKDIAKEGFVFDLSIKAGDKKISNLGGTATLSVAYDLPEDEIAEGLRVYFIDDNGKAKLVNAYYDVKTKKIVMKTDHFSVYVVSYVDVPTKVAILKAKNDKGRASLRWSRAQNEPDGYRIYRSATKDGKYKGISWIKNGKAKTYKEKAKKTKKTYYYKVRAYKQTSKGKVWGAYSPIKVVKF